MNDKLSRLAKLKEVILVCQNCPLGKTRKHIVFGEGPENPRFLSIAEAPGASEDDTGRPFMGRAGKLYRQVLQAIGLCPEKDIFMCNILKCRPPGNRIPESSEIVECIKYLKKQIEIIQPRFILILGRTAVKGLFPDLDGFSMDKLRKLSKETPPLQYENIPVLITYHPSALLYDSSKKLSFKEDFIHLQTLLKY
jgi:DNA polymerase